MVADPDDRFEAMGGSADTRFLDHAPRGHERRRDMRHEPGRRFSYGRRWSAEDRVREDLEDPNIEADRAVITENSIKFKACGDTEGHRA
jgi:hypothetical protein